MLQAYLEGNNMALGDNVKRLRRDKGWSQGDLAEASGIKVGQISKLERNAAEPKSDTIYKLINALGCTPNTLLNDVVKTNTDGLLEMQLERLSNLEEADKKALINLIDKYCIAVSLQNIVDESSKQVFGINRMAGRTQHMIDP